VQKSKEHNMATQRDPNQNKDQAKPHSQSDVYQAASVMGRNGRSSYEKSAAASRISKEAYPSHGPESRPEQRNVQQRLQDDEAEW